MEYFGTGFSQGTDRPRTSANYMELPFPPSVPYFKIISKQTYETPNKNNAERIAEIADQVIAEASR